MADERRRTASASPFEAEIGFCRALRTGDTIVVSGTAPIADDGSAHAPGDVAAQTRRCFEIAIAAIEDLGGRAEHVVRTRMMLTDIDRWREAGVAHGEIFGDIRPAATMVEVSRLIDPEWLVEVEVDAIVDG